MIGRQVQVVRRLTQLAHDACVVVAFDCFEVAHGNARLIGNLTQWQASLFSCEPQLFTDSSHRYQSASPWRLVSIALAMPVREEYQLILSLDRAAPNWNSISSTALLFGAI